MKNDNLFFIIQNCIKYIPFNWGIKFRSVVYKPFFKEFGRNIKIKDGVTFKYPSDIEIGNNVIIGEFCYFVGKSGLYIGDDVIMGAGTKVITSMHVFTSVKECMRTQGLDFKSVIIEDDVWLGFDVKVLAGSSIQKGSIIATNAVVNKNLETSYSIYTGTPAEFKRER